MNYKRFFIKFLVIVFLTMITDYIRIKNKLEPLFVINIISSDCDRYYNGLGYYIIETRDCKSYKTLEYKFFIGIVGFGSLDRGIQIK